MRRLVVSLLGVVLAATLGAGWALDRLFVQGSESASGDGPGSVADDSLAAWRTLGRGLADALVLSGDTAAAIDELAGTTGLDMRQVSARSLGLDDAALLAALDDRHGLALESATGLTLYYALGRGDDVLALAHPAGSDERGLARLLYTLTFYLVVLLLVSSWLLPLLGRLSRLSDAARAFGEGALQTRVRTRPGSDLHVLESSFNAMATRIGRLIDDNRLLGRGVAHDLKTPLARLRFGIDSLEELGEDEAVQAAQGAQGAATADAPLARRRRDHLARLQDDLDAMQHTLEAMLDYARFDARAERTSHGRIDLATLVAGRLALHDRCSALSRPTGATVVTGNERQLSALVDNLVDNALRHGAGALRVSVCPAPGGGVTLRVEDDGEGVPEPDRARILRPFERGRDGAGDRVDRGVGAAGHGLGLALVERIAERHRARLAIECSTRLGGACFTVRFPPFSGRDDSA